MTTTLIVSITLIAAAALAVAAGRAGDRAPAPLRSPLDEAERILARRYARGEITFREYGRMVAVLRR